MGSEQFNVLKTLITPDPRRSGVHPSSTYPKKRSPEWTRSAWRGASHSDRVIGRMSSPSTYQIVAGHNGQPVPPVNAEIGSSARLRLTQIFRSRCRQSFSMNKWGRVLRPHGRLRPGILEQRHVHFARPYGCWCYQQLPYWR